MHILKTLLSAICCVALAACTINISATPVVATKIQEYSINEAFKSIAKISAEAAKIKAEISGSAFAYDENTLLTAAHVCVGIEEGQIRGLLTNNIRLTYLNINNKLTHKDGVRILEIDEPNDICLVEVKNHGLLPLKLADYSTVKFGDTVYVVGAPLGFMANYEKGRVINPKYEGDKMVMIKNKLIISAATAGGNSGGPIVNDKGEVIGIIVAGHRLYDHIGIGTPSNVVQRFLKLVGR